MGQYVSSWWSVGRRSLDLIKPVKNSISNLQNVVRANFGLTLKFGNSARRTHIEVIPPWIDHPCQQENDTKEGNENLHSSLNRRKANENQYNNMINPYNRHLPADGEPSWSLLLSSVSLLLLQPEITKKDRIQGYTPTLNTFTTCVYLPKYV